MAMCIEMCFLPKTWDTRSPLPVGAEWSHAGYNLALDLLNAAGGVVNGGHLSSTRADGGHISPRHI